MFTKIEDVDGAVRQEFSHSPIPCGVAVEHRFYDADGKVIRQDQFIAATKPFVIATDKGQEIV